jgi:hypothetical protein
VRYLIVAEADRDLEQLSSRLALTERLASATRLEAGFGADVVRYASVGPGFQSAPATVIASATRNSYGSTSARI